MKIIILHEIFKELGFILSNHFKCDIVKNINDEPHNSKFILLGGHEKSLLLCELQKTKNFNYVIFQSEQMKSRFLKDKYYLQLLRSNKVLDWSFYNIDKLKRIHNINCVGIYNFQFLLGSGDIIERDKRFFDFVFIGSKNEEREEIRKYISNN